MTKDYKTALQELLQAEGHHGYPVRGCSESGPDHDKTFTVRLIVARTAPGEGQGKSKKQAQQNAAKAALSRGNRQCYLRKSRCTGSSHLRNPSQLNSTRESPELSARTAAAKATSATRSDGCWANRARRCCAAARWKRSFSTGTDSRKSRGMAGGHAVHRQQRRHTADRLQGSRHHQKNVPLRRERILYQRKPVQAAGYPRAHHGYRNRRGRILADRTGQDRGNHQQQDGRPPGDLRGSRRHRRLPDQKGPGGAKAGSDHGQHGPGQGYHR